MYLLTTGEFSGGFTVYPSLLGRKHNLTGLIHATEVEVGQESEGLDTIRKLDLA